MKTWLCVLILLIGAALRLHDISYGLSDVCLTPPDERWLYDAYQPASLYAWDVAPHGALEYLPGRVESAPLASADTPPLDRFVLRLLAVAAGLLTTAIILRLGHNLRANGWWLVGLFIAAAPWFVAADRWTVRFAPGLFALAISLFALWKSDRLPAGWPRDLAVIVQTCAALSLLLLAPPLWWLTIALLLIQPRPRWRWTTFLFLSELLLIPVLQSPELWLAALPNWDVSVIAACILIGLLIILWRYRRLSRFQQAVFLVIVVIVGGMTLYQDAQLVTPSADQWQLIHWLQARIPDDSVVQFDSATWRLASIVACPAGANLRFTAQSAPVPYFDKRDLATPYYSVSAQPDTVADMAYVTSIGDDYRVGRSLKLSHPVDVNFGDLVYLLGYDIITPTVSPSGMVDLRIDYQFGAHITPDVLAYAAFVHITPANDPATNWANYSDPFFAESGNTGSRRVMLDHHIRFTLPSTIPDGTYDLRYGIFNQSTGATVGDPVLLGTITVK